jgi:hypothetical protein
MLSEDTRHVLDWVTAIGTVLAGLSLHAAAVTLTVFATLVSATCGIIRIYDRIKYGPHSRGYRG